MNTPTCSNCQFSRRVKLSLRDAALECRAVPPQPAYHATAQGIQLSKQVVPRLVPDDYWCGMHTPLAPEVVLDS